MDAMKSFVRRQQSASMDVNAPPPPTVNPTVVVLSPTTSPGPIALIDIARVRAGETEAAVIVERDGASVRVRRGKCSEVGLSEREWPRKLEAQCVLGVVGVGDNAFFLISVIESDEVVRKNVLGAGAVRNVRRVVFTPLDAQAAFVLEGSRPGTSEPSLASKILAQLRADLEDERGFYYSPEGYDLTASLQRQAQMRGAPRAPGVHGRMADARFYWNAQLLQPFALLLDEPWLCPAMRGHIGCVEGRLLENKLAYAVILLSRRAAQHAGTRYHTRGCTDEGFAANFVESELALVVARMPGAAGAAPSGPSGPWRGAYVQTRGSVPLFWSQSGMQYKPKPMLQRTAAQNTAVLQRHLATQTALYGGPLALVSLLNLSADEAELARAFETTVAAMRPAADGAPPPRAAFLGFDFHRQVKDSKVQAIYAFLDAQLGPAMRNLGGEGPPAFFVMSQPGQQPSRVQHGVVRTNCLDCLDRTNVLQHCVARQSLAKMLEQARDDMGVSADFGWEGELLRVADAVQKLWEDNGHKISLQYAGTASLKSALLKGDEVEAAQPEPKSRLAAAAGMASVLASKVTDGANSLQRYYISNFKDDIRQQTYDALLAPPPGFNAYAPAGLDASATPEAPTPPMLRLLVCSWNVNGKPPKEDAVQAVEAWVRAAYPALPAGAQLPAPDVIVFGMQELVALDVKHALTADVASRIEAWRHVLAQSLQSLFARQGTSFEQIESKNMFGVHNWLFVADKHCAHMSKLQAEAVKIGFGGTVGNKGGVGMRFRLYDRSVCFINSHLPSGSKEVDARNVAYGEILAGLNGSLRFGRDCKVLEHDMVVWFGDLNYRVALPNEDVRSSVAVGNLVSIMEHDQLSISRENRLAYAEFDEAPIGFAPTYKYDPGTDDFDTSEKQRVPSWTDRMLFRGDGVRCASYCAAMALRTSDHKPICGLFELVPTDGTPTERAARNAAFCGQGSTRQAAATAAGLPPPPPVVMDLLGGLDDDDGSENGESGAMLSPGQPGVFSPGALGGNDSFGFGGADHFGRAAGGAAGFGAPAVQAFHSDASDGAPGGFGSSASFGGGGFGDGAFAPLPTPPAAAPGFGAAGGFGGGDAFGGSGAFAPLPPAPAAAPGFGDGGFGGGGFGDGAFAPMPTPPPAAPGFGADSGFSGGSGFGSGGFGDGGGFAQPAAPTGVGAGPSSGAPKAPVSAAATLDDLSAAAFAQFSIKR